MTTSTITWKPVAEGLPDVESNVLLGLSSGFTCEGFLDTDHEGAQVWRDVCAVEIEDAVVAWAEMPLFDSHADTPAHAVPLTDEQIDAAIVAWYSTPMGLRKDCRPCDGRMRAAFAAAYATAAPAPAVPLTDADLDRIADAVPVDQIDVHITTWHRRFARAVLSAAPAVREPLTEEQAKRLVGASDDYWATSKRIIMSIVRVTEEHYGIGGGGNG